ncbi:AbiH family protein [Ruminococcus sp.]|uniref:AbiH family protein n=1 Tax=Ruminococcus sp. TaxID=41978 RepID=UPI003AAB0504
MKNKLFVIGNGFDLAHNLPTRFDPDFKNIARKYEQDNFWDLYQSVSFHIE